MYEDIKTACLYVRFSSHNQTEQSIEGQTRVCRDFCKRHNIRIVEIYADRATSASKDIEKRVQFLKMIKDSEKGLFDAVIVYKLDRFARSRYDSATYKYRLKRNGVQLISATENISNDPEGIILESVLEGMAEFYSAELSQKINRGMRESAYKHNSIGGAIPLGYKIEDKKLVIDPKTAPIVKEAFEKYADGETVAEICRQFNARGYKTSKGTAFGKSSFTKIFRNERYIGVYTFHDYRSEDAIPAIIDKDLWDRVQLRVGKIKNAPARNKAKVVYLLSGKIFCGHCGSKMNGNCNAGNYYYYQCYGKKNGNVDCKKKNIRKEFIERLVAQDALSLLTDEYIEQIATIACEKNQHEIELDSALPTIRDRIHQVDLSLNNLLKAIESGSAPDMLVKRMGELEKEKKDLQVQAKKESEDIIELDKAQVIYWLEQFRGGNIEDKEFCRMLIDLFVNSVTVWDEDDNTYKVTVAYNLTSLPTKTYRLNKGGTLSDFTSNAPAQEQHRTRGQRDIVQPRIRSVVGGQILINFHTAGIVDKVHLHGCAVLGALDRVGARRQVLPHDVQPGGQVAVPVGAPGGYERAQVVVGVAVGLYGLFFGNFGNGLGNRGTDFTMQQDLQHGQNQKQRHNDDKPRDIGTAAASGGCLDVVLHPGRAHRGARCIVAVCAALMYMGSAFLVVVAFHLGAVARGPHAVGNILAVDAVIVGTLAPQGVAVLRRDGQTTVLTPAIDDPSAAQATFLHRDTSSFDFIIQDSVGNSKRGGKIKKPPLSKGDSASGISCPFCSRLSVQLLGKNRHQYQHQQQDKGIQLHCDILRQNAEKR